MTRSRVTRLSDEYAALLKRNHEAFNRNSRKPVSLVEYTKLLVHANDVPVGLKKKQRSFF